MLAIVYISSAVQPFLEADLTELLKQSQQKMLSLKLPAFYFIETEK